MNLQDRHAALQIRAFHDYTPVKAAGAQQRGIQDLRPVGGAKDQQSLGGIKAIHLRQKLVQGLLPLVVAAQAGISGLSDGIDLIDENDAGRILLCLLEQVPDTGCADTHEHFHEIRTAQGKERHVGFSGDCLRQQRLSGSGRPHQEGTLGQSRADPGKFSGIMQEIDDLRQALLRLIFTGNVRKGHAGLLLDVDLRIALSDAHNSAAAHAAHHEVHQQKNEHKRQDKAQQGIEHGRRVRPLPGHIYVRVVKTGDEITVVVHPDGVETNRFCISAHPGSGLDLDLGIAYHDRIHLSRIDHLEKVCIGNLPGSALAHLIPHVADDGKCDHRGKDNDQQRLAAVHSAAVSVVRALRCRVVSVVHSDSFKKLVYIWYSRLQYTTAYPKEC